jgi:hypothetical protein
VQKVKYFLAEYGSAGSADMRTNDAIAEYMLFQTWFKGIKVATKKRIQVLKKMQTVYKCKTEESDCTSPKHILKLFSDLQHAYMLKILNSHVNLLLSIINLKCLM